VHDGAAARLYVDGALAATDSTPGTASTPLAAVFFGGEDGTARYHKGPLDEMRISNVPRSSNWVWAVYQNIMSNAAFNAFSPVANGAATNGPSVFNSIQPLGNGAIRLTFSGPDGAGYELWATTNLSLSPVTLWDLVATGTYGPAPLIYDVPGTNLVRRFFILRQP
jgi:hypothetical protein